MNNRYFRDAMGKFATGITIVTMEEYEEVIGMTVNAFMSVSLDPKLIAISVDHKASMYHKLGNNKTFGLSILREDQKDISMFFANQTDIDQEVLYQSLDDTQVIEGAIATLACHIKDTIIAGDHKIFVAEVTALELNEGKPILYFGGEYRRIK